MQYTKAPIWTKYRLGLPNQDYFFLGFFPLPHHDSLPSHYYS